VYKLRIFRRSVIVAVCFIGLLLVWLLLKPGSHDVFLIVDMIAQPLSIIVSVIIGFSGSSWRFPRTWISLKKAMHTSQFWIPVGFLLICTDQLAGQGVTGYMIFITSMSTSMVVPGATWADLFFLMTYPLLIIFFFLLPTYSHTSLDRTRIVLNTFIIMVTAIIFSWYFILGPTLLQSKLDLVTRLITSAYPVADLLVIFCLLQLISRSVDANMRRSISLLALVIFISVFQDVSIEYRVLNNIFFLGTLIDACQPTAYLCFGLVFQSLRLARMEQAEQSRPINRWKYHQNRSQYFPPSGLYLCLISLLCLSLRLLVMFCCKEEEIRLPGECMWEAL